MAKNIAGLRKGGPGRPKGTPNKTTTEVKLAAQALVDDPLYRKQLRRRMIGGTLAPAIEVMLWHYAKASRRTTRSSTGT